MKTLYLLLTLLMAAPLSSFSRKIQAYLSFASFNTPENKPYMETYLSVDGTSVMYTKNKNNKFQATIEVILAIRQDTSIRYYDKYNLLSQEIEDTLHNSFSFLDQKRIPLPAGKYMVSISVRDRNTKEKAFEGKGEIEIDFAGEQSLSDIQLVESFKKSDKPGLITKSGYDMIPYVVNYYPPQMSVLRYYAEFYNKNNQESYLIKYFIEDDDKQIPLEKYVRSSKIQGEAVNSLLGEIPINQLPTGNYNLVIEARDKANNVVAAKSIFFQRNNPDNTPVAVRPEDYPNSFVVRYYDRDSLREHIRSLRPISTNKETNFSDNQVKLADLPAMQKYFYDFWYRRDPKNPEKAWNEYYAEVKVANKLYGTRILKGYETDRGRVYLQYGKPNTISANHSEPSAYPYELWHYYKTKLQSNKMFVFYNPDLVTNDFTLLHSDALGEPVDKQWQFKLFKRSQNADNFDVEKVGDSKLEDLIRTPH